MGHRRRVEKYIGKKLPSWSHVHHINGRHWDNALENLYVFFEGRDHLVFHSCVNKGTLTLDTLTSNLDGIKAGIVIPNKFNLRTLQKHRKPEKRESSKKMIKAFREWFKDYKETVSYECSLVYAEGDFFLRTLFNEY